MSSSQTSDENNFYAGINIVGPHHFYQNILRHRVYSTKYPATPKKVVQMSYKYLFLRLFFWLFCKLCQRIPSLLIIYYICGYFSKFGFEPQKSHAAFLLDAEDRISYSYSQNHRLSKSFRIFPSYSSDIGLNCFRSWNFQ